MIIISLIEKYLSLGSGLNKTFFVSDKDCECLCMEAEDLMKQSASMEKRHDLATALVLCQKAMGMYCSKIYITCNHMHVA